VLYPPDIQPDQFTSLVLLDAGSALYAPSLSVGSVGLTVPLLDASAALFPPTVIPAQFVVLGLLDSGSSLSAPTLLPGGVGLVVPLLDSGSALSAPALYQAQFLTVPLLDAGAAVYAPVVAAGGVALTVRCWTRLRAVRPDGHPDRCRGRHLQRQRGLPEGGIGDLHG
jgi:hypothetical protein